VFWKDKNLNYLGCNRLFARDAGMTAPADLVGRDDFEMGWRNEAELYRADDRRVIDSGQAKLNYEEPQTTPDGKTIWLRTSKIPLRDADDNIIGVLGTYEDITARKASVEALRRSEERYALAQRAANIASWDWDIASGQITWSDQTEPMFGLARDELGTTYEAFLERVYPEDRPQVQEAVDACIRHKGEYAVEHRIIGPDRTVRWVSARGDVTRDEEGRAVRLLGVVQDITARKQAEQEKAKLEAQLRQAQKMEAIGQLAGGIAHDFNNILTAIFGNLELSLPGLKAKLGADEPLLVGLGHIEQSAQRAAALTRQLLAFSRRQVSQPDVIDLNRTLLDMENMLERLLTENIRLKSNFAPDVRNVRVDAGHFEQVVMNLVVNARDAMPDGGELTLETSNIVLDETFCHFCGGLTPGPHVMLAVSDTGCGMDSETAERIFEPFFTTKPRGRGTGLGLSTVYGIMNQAGGHIAVYSEPGRGTTFRVYMPAVDAPITTARTARSADRLAAGTGTILVCEDDEAVRNLAVHILNDVGYTVLAACNGAEALDLARTHEGAVDLVVTDVIMPDMNGKQLADALSDVRPGLRTLFVSGYTSDVIAHHGVLDDGVQFLEKPFTRHSLLHRVRDAIASNPNPPQTG
jgi:PAS domain S-box-containing protein